jgi:tRNA (guanine37-N1)-methyltransferase
MAKLWSNIRIKPKEWRGLEVPEILLSGNHGEIAKWRLEQALIRTKNYPN